MQKAISRNICRIQYSLRRREFQLLPICATCAICVPKVPDSVCSRAILVN